MTDQAGRAAAIAIVQALFQERGCAHLEDFARLAETLHNMLGDERTGRFDAAMDELRYVGDMAMIIERARLNGGWDI